MQINRRTALAFLSASALPAFAQGTWPDKPIRLVLPFSAGGPGDISTRQFAQALSLQLRQSIIVDNKLGAGGIIGSDFVAKSPADGYTLLIAGNGAVANALLRPKMPYAETDLVPVIATNSSPSVIVISATSPIRTLKDLQAYPGGTDLRHGRRGKHGAFCGRDDQVRTRCAGDRGALQERIRNRDRHHRRHH